MKNKTKKKEQLMNRMADDYLFRVQTEQYPNLADQFMNLAGKTDNKADLIKKIITYMKAMTGYEAVGIRLKDGEDYPYYETIGFSRDFVTAEKYLCARDRSGELIRDSRGRPYLECMCGNIISGRTDPTQSFFTGGGSFWTNSTTELLASTTREDRQGRTRNRCNSGGYESVALIPLRYGEKIIGLLQFNDSRKDVFTSSLIGFFEGVGCSIGMALEFRQIYEDIHQSRQNLHTAEEIIITFHDRKFNIIQANKTAKEMLGLPPLDGREIKCYEYYHGKSSPPKQCPSCRCVLTGEPVVFEIFEPHLNKHVEIRAFPQFGADGDFSGLIHFVRDITDEHVFSSERRQ